MKWLHLPIALPELLFLPFFLYFKPKVRLNKISISTIIGILGVGLFLIISILHGRYGLIAVLSTARGYLYIVLVALYFRNRPIRSLLPIYILSLGASIGWLFLSLVSFIGLQQGNADETNIAVYGNMVAIGVMMAIPILQRNKRLILLSLLVGILIALTAGVRRQIAVLGITTIVSFLLTFKITHLHRYLLLVVLVAGLSFSTLPYLKAYMADVSPILYYRVITKTEGFLSGERSASDNIRLTKIHEFIDSIDNYILPKGFVSKRTMIDEGANDFMDYPFTELFYTFGWLLVPIFLFFFANAMFFHINNYFFNHTMESALCVVYGVMLLVLIMIEGSFLNFAYIVPMTGFVLGRIFTRRKLVST